MDLITAMVTEDDLTENGAVTHSTSGQALVDLFFKINAMRASSDQEVLQAWTLAFGANPLDAMRILFYSRDIRGGQGERRVFRVILKDLAERHPDVVRKNLHLVGVYGRFDDLLVLLDTQLEKDVLGYIKQTLVMDAKQVFGEDFSLENIENFLEDTSIPFLPE